jgi:hypothetical protein
LVADRPLFRHPLRYLFTDVGIQTLRATVSDRLWQILLLASTLALCWLAMQAVHEFGHVLHTWISGGRVDRVVLHPLTISRTDLADNPHPLFVVWGGPVWGCILPLVVLEIIRRTRWPVRYLFAFFAGFCLIANGAYIGGGAFAPAGDAEVMIQQRTPRWVMAAFGLSAVAGGLALWNGLGAHFGLGKTQGRVDRRAAVAMTVIGLLWIAYRFSSAVRTKPVMALASIESF